MIKMSNDVTAADNFENSLPSRPSVAQMKIIVEFMKKHPDLAQRKNGLGTQKFKKLWVQLSKTINSMDGAFKSTKGWIKFWTDKRKSVIVKNRQIVQGKITDPLNPLDKMILEICDGSTFTIKKNKAVKQEPCNGDDFNNDDLSDEPLYSDEDDLELSRLKSKRLHSDTEERYTNMMEKLVDAMDQQATAMAHIAEASLGNAKALEQVAAANHMQALAIERLANTFDSVSSSAQDLKNAIMSIDYTMKRYYNAPTTERHNSNFFT